MFDMEKAKQNAKRLNSELDRLEGGHRSLFQRDYRSFWAHVKEINELFKSLKPLDKEDRDKLWTRMDTLCKNCKEQQQKEIDNCSFKSGQHKDWIIKQVESCRPLDGIMATLSLGLLASNVAEIKDMGKRLREAGQYLSKYKLEMTPEHKAECFERIKDVQHAQDVWWKGYKESHQQHKEQENLSREERQRAFRNRVKTNIEKNKERYAHASEALRKMNASADDLREKISSAYNDSWKDKAYGWLSELEEKIDSTEAHLKRIEEWIKEDEDKLHN
jgi:hypothetical protein